MRRQCAWFGCHAVAIATYTFDSNARIVWLDTPLDGAARAGELCHRHARSLTPPRGWSIEDRRPAPMPVAQPPVADHDGDRIRVESEAELRTLLDAHSPLLARAFRSSGAL